MAVFFNIFPIMDSQYPRYLPHPSRYSLDTFSRLGEGFYSYALCKKLGCSPPTTAPRHAQFLHPNTSPWHADFNRRSRKERYAPSFLLKFIALFTCKFRVESDGKLGYTMLERRQDG